MEKLEIKNDAELQIFANQMATEVNKINAEAVRIGDLDLVKKENADLKARLDVTAAELNNVKELMKNRFASKSTEEKLFNIGKFLYAARKNDMNQIHSLGGRMNMSPGELYSDDWKSDSWNVNAAPDLGTPLRGDAVTGSYLVPEAFAAEILRLPADPSALMNQVRSIPMNTRKITYPTTSTGVTYSWPTNEVTAKTEKNPAFGYVELEAKTAAGWVPFTEELNEDSLVPLGEYFASLFRDAWQTEFDKQCLNSSAAPFTGVLQASGTKVLTMGAGKTSFASAKFDDLYDLISKLTTQAARNGAKFIMHTTVGDIFKKIKDDLGNYIYQQPAGAAPATLCGYPIIFSDAMPDANSSAKSTAFVAFGNPQQIIHGNRVGMEIKIFNQTADALVYDRLFLRSRLRQGFVVGRPDAFAVLKTAAA